MCRVEETVATSSRTLPYISAADTRPSDVVQTRGRQREAGLNRGRGRSTGSAMCGRSRSPHPPHPSLVLCEDHRSLHCFDAAFKRWLGLISGRGPRRGQGPPQRWPGGRAGCRGLPNVVPPSPAGLPRGAVAGGSRTTGQSQARVLPDQASWESSDRLSLVRTDGRRLCLASMRRISAAFV